MTELTEMKRTLQRLASAFASNVFPVPGGPVSRTPLIGATPASL